MDSIAVNIEKMITNYDSFEQPMVLVSQIIEKFYEINDLSGLEELKYRVI